MLIGPAAERYAAAHGCEQVPPDWFGTPRRLQQLRAAQAASQVVLDHVVMDPAAPLDERGKFGTVGAVARDAQGRLAAATSTGGMTNKRPGRVGDSPILGAGCYADDRSVAVSCTGVGESFIRAAAAHEVSALVRHAGLGTREAARRVVHEVLPPLGGHGGLIAVGADGEVALPFNTEGMYRGWARVGQAPVVAIYEGEDIA
jgi:beta-aspartyl-peptidase (threonine type)